MNRENIQATIDILQRAQNFCVTSFQGDGYLLVKTEEELHACGNTACIAGYVALSSAWRNFGGTVDSIGGSPFIETPTADLYGSDAMAHFWGIDNGTAASIVYGDFWPDFVLNNDLGRVAPRYWGEMTKEQAVAMFEHFLKAGEIKPAVSYGD